jgi:hypothetical protein
VWTILGALIPLLYLIAQGWSIAVRFSYTIGWPTARSRSWAWLVRFLTTFPGAVLSWFMMLVVGFVAIIWLDTFHLLPGPSFAWLALPPVVWALSSILAWCLVRAMYRRGFVDAIRIRSPLVQSSWLSGDSYGDWSHSGWRTASAVQPHSFREEFP